MSENLRMNSGAVLLEPSDIVTTAILNKALSDGFVSILTPITIGQGGTGADNAKDARANLGIPSIKSIKGFGAKGDGLTDDTNAVQAAVDDADDDILYVDPGTYLINGPIIVPSNTNMFGAGAGVSIFENTNTAGNDAFTLNGTGANIEAGVPVTDVTFKDFAVKGNALSGHGISGNIVERICFSQLKLDDNGKNGINIGADNNTLNNKFGGVYIIKCLFNINVDAVKLSGGIQALVSGCNVEEYGVRGIVFVDCWSAVADGNRGISVDAGSTNALESNSSVLNNADVRSIRSNHFSNNSWEDVLTGENFILVETQGTTENCASSAVGNMADKTVADFDFLVLVNNIESFRVESNVIASDAGAGAVGITIGAGANLTFISSGNCFENGINIVDNGSGTIVGTALSYIQIQDQKANGVDGGTFTSGAWRTRDLNTIVTDTTGAVILAANQFTLPIGSYEIKARAPAYAVNSAQARLRNITDATTTLVSDPSIINSGGEASVMNFISGRFTITAAKVFEIQHIALTTRAPNGFGSGQAGTIGGNSEIMIYTNVELRKIS